MDTDSKTRLSSLSDEELGKIIGKDRNLYPQDYVELAESIVKSRKKESGVEAPPTRPGFFRWYFTKGAISGLGLFGTPILFFSILKLLPLTLAVLRGEPMAYPVLGALAGPTGIALGVFLISKGYAETAGAVRPQTVQKVTGLCHLCGVNIEGSPVTTYTAISKFPGAMEKRRGVQCKRCATLYCNKCATSAFKEQGLAYSPCRKCGAKLSQRFEILPEEELGLDLKVG